jgi:hypothetical protein
LEFAELLPEFLGFRLPAIPTPGEIANLTDELFGPLLLLLGSLFPSLASLAKHLR